MQKANIFEQILLFLCLVHVRMFQNDEVSGFYRFRVLDGFASAKQPDLSQIYRFCVLSVVLCTKSLNLYHCFHICVLLYINHGHFYMHKTVEFEPLLSFFVSCAIFCMHKTAIHESKICHFCITRKLNRRVEPPFSILCLDLFSMCKTDTFAWSLLTILSFSCVQHVCMCKTY